MDAAQLHDAGLDDWAPVANTLRTRFRTGRFTVGLALVDALAAAAEEAGHHPEITLAYGHVDVRLTSHDTGDVSDRDIALARRFSVIAAEHGIAADPAAVRVVEIGLDTADADAIRPFWQAVLGLPVSGGGELVDPAGSSATLWFQPTEPHPEPRQRFHYDVWVDPRVAAERIAAALAAGGTLVSDAAAPEFWVLADADGNKACICTVEGRH